MWSAALAAEVLHNSSAASPCSSNLLQQDLEQQQKLAQPRGASRLRLAQDLQQGVGKESIQRRDVSDTVLAGWSSHVLVQPCMSLTHQRLQIELQGAGRAALLLLLWPPCHLCLLPCTGALTHLHT